MIAQTNAPGFLPDMLTILRAILLSSVIALLATACSSRSTMGDAVLSHLSNGTPSPQPSPGGRGSQVRHEFSRLLMGVQARIVLFHEDVVVAEEAANAAFDRIAGLDAILSDYRVDSEVNRLCTFAGTGETVPVSDDLFEVLARSVAFSRASGGAFDVTVRPVVVLWREARRSGVIPSRAEIDRAMESVGWEKIELVEAIQTVRLTMPNMRLDFGGIGKGYACDEALKVLRAFACPRAMVEMGGDIALGDPPSGGDGWNIDLSQPSPFGRGQGEGGLEARAESPAPSPPTPLPAGEGSARRMLSNCGVGTSGDRFQFVEFEGVRYSHVIDPRTGWALPDSNETTIIAADATTADALATAASVLGDVETKELADRFPGARLIDR